MTLGYRERHANREEDYALSGADLRAQLEEAGFTEGALLGIAEANEGYWFERVAARLAEEAGWENAQSLRDEYAEEPALDRLVEAAALTAEYGRERSQEWLESWPDARTAQEAAAVADVADAAAILALHPGDGMHRQGWEKTGISLEMVSGDLESIRKLGLGPEEAAEGIRWTGGRLALIAAEVAEARTGAPPSPEHVFEKRIGRALEQADGPREEEQGQAQEQYPEYPEYRDITLRRLENALADARDVLGDDGWQDMQQMDPKGLTPTERSMLFSQMMRAEGYQGAHGTMMGMVKHNWLERAGAQETARRVLERFDTGEDRDRTDRDFLIRETAEGATDPGFYREYCRQVLEYGTKGDDELARWNMVNRTVSDLREVTGDGPSSEEWLRESEENARTACATFLLRLAPGPGSGNENRANSELFFEAKEAEAAWLSGNAVETERRLQESARRMLLVASEKALEQYNLSLSRMEEMAQADGSPEAKEMLLRLEAGTKGRMEEALDGDVGLGLEANAHAALEAAQLEWEWSQRGTDAARRWQSRHAGGPADEDPEGFPSRIGEGLRQPAVRGREESERIGEILQYRKPAAAEPLGYCYNRGGRPESWGNSGDCVTRSVSILVGEENYQRIWDELHEAKQETGQPHSPDHGVPPLSYEPVLARWGLERVYSANAHRRMGPLDVHEINAATGSADCIMAGGTHMSAVRNGEMNDTFDWTSVPTREPVEEVYVRAEDAERAREKVLEYLERRSG